MVLASNEWLNNCDDDQKSATAATTTTTAAASTTTPATATTATTISAATTTFINISTQSIPAVTTTATTITATTTTTTTGTNITTNNANNESIEEGDQQHQLQPDEQKQELSMIFSNNLKIMAENNPIESTSIPNPKQNELETTNEIKNESENNNQAAEEQEEEHPVRVTNDNVANANSNITDNSSNQPQQQQQPNFNLNSNPNSNTSTLVQASIARSPKSTPIITPQALSSALQSVMNSTAAVSTAGATPTSAISCNNLQNNFLSTLGIGGGVPSGTNTLQQQPTAKQQLSSTFCETNFTNNSSNLTNNLDITAADNAEHSSVGQAKIILLCEANSHPFQTRTIVLTSNIECKVGRLIAKSKAAESNAIFDCKVLSRNHAVLWYSSDDGKFWVKDTKSSNGTFINENKLGADAAELHFGDIVKFGVDVLENSRKEVHGCIIACVKLYLPDGREAISIDAANQQQRSQYSGEGRISFDELHRLNLYMQEASQRESLLKSKLFNIQNILDATRKNSAVCWQSMIAEDQLLHRIHSLEKKLQIMEKNVPESVLRNEVLKLLDDKNSYQHTAKEALRKVYQERCDAMQMLSKMEAAYTTSDNECKILRDQIMNTKQSLQDVNSRLLRLQTEYNEFKDETERQQQEAKEQEEQRTVELMEKLKQREMDCEELRHKISELLLKRAELLDDEEQLQKQAFDKLDAAIADMDLGDDDDDDEDDDEENDDVNANEDDELQKPNEADNEDDEAHEKKKKVQRTTAKERRKKSHFDLLKNGEENVVDTTSNSSDSEKEKTDSSPNKVAGEPQMPAKQKVAKESTIMKWLQNSDLNKTAGSLEIFQAICNESDSSDERDDATTGGASAGELSETGAGANATTTAKKFTKFPNKLRNVQRYIKQLETAIANETTKPAATNLLATLAAAATDGSSAAIFAADYDSEDDDDEEEGDEVDDEFIIKRNGKLNEVLSKGATDNKNYLLLLKRSVAMLCEAYNEIWDNVQEQLQQQEQQTNQGNKAAIERSPPPAISVQTQFQNYAQHKPGNSAAIKLEPKETLRPLPESAANETTSYTDDDEDSRTTASSMPNTSEDSVGENQKLIEKEIRCYQQQIAALNGKLEQIENDSQNTLEMIQIESDAFKERVIELTKLIETLREEKQILEAAAISGNTAAAIERNQLSRISEEEDSSRVDEILDDIEKHQVEVVAGTTDNSVVASFERQMREELAALSSGAMQREEELIMYKERLEHMQTDNLELRSQMKALRQQQGCLGNAFTPTQLKRMLPYGAVVVAVLVYFISTYF